MTITYPHFPGSKVAGTSYEAAAAEAGRAVLLRERVLEVLKREPLTADECAGAIGESILAVRPRLSELRALGKIAATEQRRRNASGRAATVWRVVTVQAQREFEL